MSPRERVSRRIKENERAIKNAERVEEQIDKTIRESDERTERAREILRKAGYLRQPA